MENHKDQDLYTTHVSAIVNRDIWVLKDHKKTPQFANILILPPWVEYKQHADELEYIKIDRGSLVTLKATYLRSKHNKTEFKFIYFTLYSSTTGEEYASTLHFNCFSKHDDKNTTRYNLDKLKDAENALKDAKIAYQKAFDDCMLDKLDLKITVHKG